MLQLDFLPHTLSQYSLPAGLVQGLKDCSSKMELLKGQEHYSLHVQDYIRISVSSLGFTVLIMCVKNSHLFLQCAPKRICSFVSRHAKACLSIKAWHMWSGKGLLLHAPASCSEIHVLKPSRCKMTAKSGGLYWSWQWIISKHLVCTKQLICFNASLFKHLQLQIHSIGIVGLLYLRFQLLPDPKSSPAPTKTSNFSGFLLNFSSLWTTWLLDVSFSSQDSNAANKGISMQLQRNLHNNRFEG